MDNESIRDDAGISVPVDSAHPEVVERRAKLSLEDSQARVLEAVVKQFHEDLLHARKDNPWDPKQSHGKNDYFHWLGKIGIDAHNRTQAWAKKTFPNVEAEHSADRTRLDLAFNDLKLQVELKSSLTGLSNSAEQQMWQVRAAAKKHWAYAAVTGMEKGKRGDYYWLTIRATRSTAKQAGWF